MTKQGLYANIHAKKRRIAGGSKETMRKPGSKGAPTAANFKAAAKTAKTPKKAAMGGEMKVSNPMMKKKGYAKGGAAKKPAAAKMRNGGAMMKKKGYAKGGAAKKPVATKMRNGGAMMKKKGFAKGGAAKMKRGGAARKK
tara:strand:- start:642 stop:1061 length:420 start_codon:yes stop_codon:yes gene_type:complete